MLASSFLILPYFYLCTCLENYRLFIRLVHALKRCLDPRLLVAQDPFKPSALSLEDSVCELFVSHAHELCTLLETEGILPRDSDNYLTYCRC